MQLIKDFLPLVIFFVSIQVSGLIFPLIIKRSYRKKFFKQKNHRTAHSGNVSTLGGIGIFVGYFVGINVSLYVYYQELSIVLELYSLLFPLLMIFILGVWDDLNELKAWEKILLQLLASISLMVLNPGLLTLNFEGFLGIEQFPYWISFLLHIVTVFFIINAANLLDGIDGLLAGYLLIVSVFVFLIYLSVGHTSGQIVVAALIGSLSLFLYYNLFNKRKLFMGDSGSLSLGLFLIYFSLDILHMVQKNELPEFNYGFSWAFMLLALPLIDTIRVMIVRYRNGAGILTADRNHIHHRYLKMGLKHKQITSTLLILTLTLWIFGFITMEYLSQHLHFVSVVLMAIVLYLGPIIIIKPIEK